MSAKMGSVEDMLNSFSPEQQALARGMAQARVENKALKAALSTSQKQYAELYLFMMAVLRQMPGYEIKFKASDLEAYSQFKESWQMQSEFIEETEEQCLRLVEKGVPDGTA